MLTVVQRFFPCSCAHMVVHQILVASMNFSADPVKSLWFGLVMVKQGAACCYQVPALGSPGAHCWACWRGCFHQLVFSSP